ncbi:MAG: erythronate-4-phosphate dehydrogenase [Bacteroidales bacterium 36-12]|nr:MAG: erythronate-4-phosphate dehydrogenase [Bacteroidales bacterium 36-12]
MKIIIDDKIPYIKGAFEEVADVIYLPGSKTTPDVVKDADAIITRTRTICNEQLLAGSSVKFIATATIGYDHIDTEYCDKNGIKWTNAPGCNSKSVEQYIASVLMVLAEEKDIELDKLCIGVVGVGNVGSKIARFCELLGMRVLLNDPPRERTEGSDKFVSLEKIKQEADIITLHVPLNMKGEDATYHLCDNQFFESLSKKVILINSCRGEVVETKAVKNAIKTERISTFVCDCWENEPDIDLELLDMTYIATPHIAGYSKDGKATGTRMSVEAINNFFNLGLDDWKPRNVELPSEPVIIIDGDGLTEQDIISKAVLHTYDIRKDDELFKSMPSDFEKQRGDYPVRREFPAYSLQCENVEQKVLEKLGKIGFGVDS